jgi:hypothetical protein
MNTIKSGPSGFLAKQELSSTGSAVAPPIQDRVDLVADALAGDSAVHS